MYLEEMDWNLQIQLNSSYSSISLGVNDNVHASYRISIESLELESFDYIVVALNSKNLEWFEDLPVEVRLQASNDWSSIIDVSLSQKGIQTVGEKRSLGAISHHIAYCIKQEQRYSFEDPPQLHVKVKAAIQAFAFKGLYNSRTYMFVELERAVWSNPWNFLTDTKNIEEFNLMICYYALQSKHF